MLKDGRLNGLENRKLCSICLTYKPFGDFYKDYKGDPCGTYCKSCQHDMYVARKEQGESYKIECSYCGTPISKAPFCNEKCRKAFEALVSAPLQSS